MGRRGRPRHPDILTPREWEVLALLRGGLSNPKIAQRVALSRDTVKTHVSEILSKLGVATREEAAAWQPEPVPVAARRRWWVAVAWLRPLTAAKVAGAGIVVATVAALGVLAWGVWRTSGSEEGPVVGGATPAAASSAAPSPALFITSRQDALDLAIEQVTNDGSWPVPELLNASAEEMLYGEAARIASQYGLSLSIQPDDYYCPPGAQCPYPGEPADARGWLIVLEARRGEFAAAPEATHFIAWVGEDGGLTDGFTP